MTNYLKLFEGLILLEQDPEEEEYVDQEGEDGGPPDDPGDYDEGEGEEMPPEEGTEEEEGGGEEGGGPTEKSEEEAIDDITKVYRMKRIYSRLTAIYKYMEYFNDHQLDDLKSKIEEALDLFHTVIMNYKSVKERVDDIIRKYERFLVVCSDELEKFVSKRKTKSKLMTDYYRRKR